MTLLISGSIVLILGSAATLAWGWIDQNETMIWVSIVLSAAAAICLALAYHRSKREAQRPAGPVPGTPTSPALGVEPAAEEEEEEKRAETPTGEPSPEAAAPAATEEFSALDAAGEAAPMAGAGHGTGSAGPSSGRSTSKPARHPTSGIQEVVAIPERKKFHRPDCRYAKSAGAERMTKAQARRRSFSACGICKP